MTSLVMATSPALAEYQFRVPLEPHPVSVGGGTLSISTSSLDFGSVGVGAGRQLFVDVFNSGEGSVTFSGISTTGSHFASSSNCASQLAAGSGCRINVIFSPASTGAATGRLSIRSNDVVAEYAIALSGNGQSGTLSASGLTFPSTLQVGDTAASDSVRVTNIGTAPVAISGVSVATGADSFAQANNCGGTLQPGGYCTINVAFAPAAAGPRAGTIAVTSDADGSPLFIPLFGQGAQASATLTASSFGNEQIGSTKVFGVVLKNTGVGPLAISGMAVTGADYTEATGSASTCSSTLAAGAECQYLVAFTPTAAGARAGQASATTSAGVLVASLAGTGVSASAELAAPAFGTTAVGASSSGTAKLTNTGIGPLELTIPGPESVTGDGYAFESTTCVSPLQPGADCDVVVSFTPASSGSLSGTLTVNTGAGTKTVALGSTAIQGFAAISPASLQFSSVQVGSSSAGQSVTVTNTGSNTLTFTGVGISSGNSDFAQSNNCGSVAVGASCTVTVSFTPATAGARTGTLSFAHNGGGLAHVSLSGTGQAPSATLSEVAFGDVQVGQSKVLTSTLTNTGIGSISVTAPSATSIPASDYSFVSTTCGSTLAAGQTCAVTVQFTAAETGSRSGTLTVATSAGNHSAALSGTGVAQSVAARGSSSLSGAVPHAASSGGLGQVMNTGIGPITVTGVSYSGTSGFRAWWSGTGSLNWHCANGFVLQPGQSCGAWMQADGAVGETHSGTATIATSAGNVTFSGSFTIVGLTLSQHSGATPNATSGQTGNLYTVTWTNSTPYTYFFPQRYAGGGVATVGRFVNGDAGKFVVTGTTCGGTLAAGASCTVSVAASGITEGRLYSTSLQPNGTFQQTSVGSAGTWSPGSWLMNMGTAVAPVYVSGSSALSLTAQTYDAALSPSSLSFGAVPVGGSTDLSSTLTNTGTAPLSITVPNASSVSGTDFTFVSSTCPSSLASGASCAVTVRFAPTVAASRAGSLTLSTSAGTKTVSLAATGQQAVLSFTPATLSAFGNVQVGQAADSAQVTLSNTGNVAASSLALAAPSGYSIVNSTCGTSLNSGASCTFNLRFAPLAAQTYTGNVAATAATPAAAATVAVSGNGVSQSATLSDITFGNRNANSTTDLTSVLVNTGSGPLSVTVPAAGSVTGTSFSFVSTTCGASIAVGGSCSVTVRFNPTNNNAYSGSLSVATGAGTMTAALSGQGLQATGIVNPTSLTFSATQVAQTAVTQAVTVSNTGNTPLNITGVSISTGATDFAQSNNCGSTLANGSSCTVYVAFTPAAAGSRTGTLSMTHDGLGGVANVSLSGTGQAASVELTGIDFGDVVVGQSKPGVATLRNTGVGTVTFTQPSAASISSNPGSAPGFAFASTTCGTSLAAGQSCTVTILGQPTATGSQSTHTGTLRVSFATPGLGTKSADLMVMGIAGQATLDQGWVWLGEQPVGTSHIETVTLTNAGTAPLTVTGVSVTEGGSDYAQSNNCGAALQVGESCAIVVQFTPTEVDYRPGTLTILTDSVVTPVLSATLAGMGTSPGQAVLSLSHPGTHESYGVTLEMQRYVGTSGSIGTFTLTNTGNATATGLLVPATIPSGWSVSASTCASTLAAGASCTFDAVFTPTAPTTYSGQLTVSTSSGTAGQGYTLSGTGIAEPWYVFRASDGKVWYRDMSAARTVAAAVTTCQQLNYSGTGYRMPNQTEATTLRSQLSANGKLANHQTQGGDYVMTTTTQASAYRWVTLSTGTVTNRTASTTGYAYCVRDS